MRDPNIRQHLRNMEDYIENPKDIAKTDKIIQLFEDEKWNFYAVFSSGRIFKKRAKGSAGSYDMWQELDVLGEIKEDLSLNQEKEDA